VSNIEHDESGVTWLDGEAYTPLTDRERALLDVAAMAQKERDTAQQQLEGAVEALLELAAIHHGTITPSRLHNPRNRDWTECECRSCLLARPFGGQ
jgi:hypothetical protein